MRRQTSTASRIPRDFATDAALRPHPRRDGPDYWPTPNCLAAALLKHVEPLLPAGALWEPAAGDGRLAGALHGTGRAVVCSDILLDQDFLTMPVPPHCVALVTNPPFNAIDDFVARALALLEDPHNGLRAAVLLARWDHLPAGCRAPMIERARAIFVSRWRPRWIAGSTTSPRWHFAWILWCRGWRGPPALYWMARPDA